MNLEDLQKSHELYDKERWEHYETQLEDVRHVALHLGKLLGKVSDYCERLEHGKEVSDDKLCKEVIPDLLVWSLHLGNSLAVNVQEAYFARLRNNDERLRRKL